MRFPFALKDHLGRIEELFPFLKGNALQKKILTPHSP
jgi:hypothetical protein